MRIGMLVVPLLLAGCLDWQSEALLHSDENVLPVSCEQPLLLPYTARATPNSSFSILSWNAAKFASGWQQDWQQAVSSDVDLVLLQEMSAYGSVTQQLSADNWRWLQAEGYINNGIVNGVAQLFSDWSPVSACVLRQAEPWLRIPKTVIAAWYTTPISGELLLVINVHGVNFEWDNQSQLAQLAQIKPLIAQHSGPVILAGDFNSWNDSRRFALDDFSQRLRLVEVRFVPENRSRFMGHVVDRVYVRDVDVVHAEVISTQSSDHQALRVEFAWSGASFVGSDLH